MTYQETVSQLIREGKIVDPRTKQKLTLQGNGLASESNSYNVKNGVPILLYDEKMVEAWIIDSKSQKLSKNLSKQGIGFLKSFNNFLQKDLRTKDSIRSWEKIKNDANGKVCVSIGGGPRRCDENFINLNISDFENVDLVGDCHYLPFSDNSIDYIYIEAVLEHLYDIQKCIKEMYRVLKKGGMIYSDTPFMQAYHGYPNHYQNLTLSGHATVYEINNFQVIESGVSVKPTYAMIILTAAYLKNYIPWVGKYVSKIYSILALLTVKYLDVLLERNPNSFVLASSTYVLVKKPE